jgi:hypothetical protein
MLFNYNKKKKIKKLRLEQSSAYHCPDIEVWLFFYIFFPNVILLIPLVITQSFQPSIVQNAKLYDLLWKDIVFYQIFCVLQTVIVHGPFIYKYLFHKESIYTLLNF